MNGLTVKRAWNSTLYKTGAFGFFATVVACLFSYKPDMVTDLTMTVSMFFVNVVCPKFPVGLIPYYDTIVWICQFAGRFLPMVSTIMSFLEMSTYAFVMALPVLPWIGGFISEEQMDSMRTRFEDLIDENLHQGDVFWTAGFILCLLSIIIWLISFGTSQQKMVIIWIPKKMETYSNVIWFFFQCGVGYCTTLTRDPVENIFGHDSFFVFQVVVLVINHILCFHQTVSANLNNVTTLHSIPGCLFSTGDVNSLPPKKLKELCTAIEEYFQVADSTDEVDVWQISVGDIDTNEGPYKELHAKIQPAKNTLSQFGSLKQTAGEKQYVLALNFLPNTVAFTIFIVAFVYVAASDVANLRGNVPTYTFVAWQFVADTRSNALDNGITPVVYAPPNLKCSVLYELQNATTHKDTGNKENTTQQTPEANTTDEMPRDEVPDGSVQDSDKTIMLAVGTAVTSGVGYGIYWLMTQG